MMNLPKPVTTLAISAILLVTVATTATAASYSVIVHPDNPIDNLSSRELRDIFEADLQSWDGGAPIVLLVPQSAATYDMLLNTVHRRDAEQMKRLWVAKVYRGQLTEPPQTVRSSAIALRRVATQPGAITIVPSELVSADVKVLKIDGLRPGEPGYALMDKRGLY